MSSKWGQRLLDLVDSAMAVDPAHRASWLDEACADDEELRSEIESLLAYDLDASSLLGVDAIVPEEADRSPHHDAVRDTAPGSLQPGQRLGDYLIERQIGAGGMGVVYRARQVSLNRMIALKVLPSHLQGSATGVSRFQREVEATAQLRHPNIVSIYATGETNGASHYAMELIEGPNLSEIVAHLRCEPIPELRSTAPPSEPLAVKPNETPTLPTWLTAVLSTSAPAPGSGSTTLANARTPSGSGGTYFHWVARLLVGVADGLDYAHQKQIVHRDIKPSNLLLSEDGRLHVSDFGLARVLAEPSVTQTGEVVGTPYYMAPEQIRASSGGVDGRTDVYALGATLYEMLTLRPPHPGSCRDVVFASILQDEPTPPRHHNRRVPRDLETICLKALEKDPEHRYVSASALGEDLRRFVSNMPISARRSGVIARGVKWCRRHPSMAVSLGLAAGLAIASSVLAYRAHDAEQRLNAAETQQVVVAAQANQVEADLASAQQAVEQANRSEQQRVFSKAMLASMQGDFESANAAVSQAKSLGATAGTLHVLRGQIALFAGRFKTATVELEEAVKLMPDSVSANALLAETCSKRARWSRAGTLLARVQELEPSSVEDLLVWGRSLSYHDPLAAIEPLNKAIAKDRQSIVARLIRGDVRTKLAMNSADPTDAQNALEDLRLADSLLDPGPYLLSQLLHANLVAATAYEAAGKPDAEREALEAAGTLASKLEHFNGDYLAHRWRAFYFDRIGEEENAIAEWRRIKRKTTTFLVLTLYRTGQLDEALAVCDEARSRTTSGVAELWRPFVIAASCRTVDELRAECNFQTLQARDPRMAWLGTYTMWCLMGSFEQASRSIEAIEVPVDVVERNRALFDFYRGVMTVDELTQHMAPSRSELSAVHLRAGLKRLASGDRDAARRHFEQCTTYRITFDYSTFISQALLAQFDRDPSWPPWIPSSTDAKDAAEND